MLRKYRITLEDRSHLETIARHDFKRWQGIALLVGGILAIMGLTVVLMLFTPLSELLPKRMEDPQRNATIEDIQRVDSLQAKVDENQAYIENLMNVMNVDRRPTDSASYSKLPTSRNSDSLNVRSARETEFIKMMDERERYNLSILAPMAAEGMIFGDVCSAASYAADAMQSPLTVVNVPAASTIVAVTDGMVIDTRFNPGVGYSVIMIHPNGFVTRYNRLGRPYVQPGDEVAVGEAIAPTARGMGLNPNVITLEMWRNGTRLIPYAIIRERRHQSTAPAGSKTEEKGRGQKSFG